MFRRERAPSQRRTIVYVCKRMHQKEAYVPKEWKTAGFNLLQGA
jgi:hypothetical protein